MTAHKTGGKKKALWIVLLAIGAVLLAFGAHTLYLFISTPDEYMITTDNYFDYQRHYECSGYASAYALRSLGEEADGVKLYYQFEDKNSDGTLAPGYLWENLKRLGYKSGLYSGRIIDLKHAVSKGTPVVALIKVYTDKPYLHYVPIVGYDEEYFYIADSLDYMVNADGENYNRTVLIGEFKELWKNDVFFVDNIYLTVGV